MNIILKCLIPGFIVLALTSCFKEDEKAQPHQSGNVTTDTIALTNNYKYQVYFDLSSDTKVATNLRTDWDLAFECSSTGTHILLNSSCFMKAADCGLIPFAQAIDTAGLKWNFDRSDGNPDSTVLLNWLSINGNDTLFPGHVYAIDRGMDENGNIRGLQQVVFDGLKQGHYTFRWARINGSSITSAIVEKDSTSNYMHYSFKNGGGLAAPEPPKQQWDLLFTQYSTILFTDAGDPQPYLLTGVLINRSGLEVAVDSAIAFSSINYETAQSMTYSNALDIIGYDWKKVDSENGYTYTVRYNVNYVIKDAEGYYYKLRFTGFYNELGEKGFPVFEYQQL
ncbi:MAG: HmuY family protein [Bacteroidales bacterium]